MRNKFPARCCGCRVSVSAEAGWLLGKSDDGYWEIECEACYAKRIQAQQTAEAPRTEPPPRQDPFTNRANAFREKTNAYRNDQAWSKLEEMLAEMRRKAEMAPFRVLGLQPPITLVSVKAAYRRKAKETHPDLGGSTEAFVAVQNAYEAALKFVGAEAVI